MIKQPNFETLNELAKFFTEEYPLKPIPKSWRHFPVYKRLCPKFMLREAERGILFMPRTLLIEGMRDHVKIMKLRTNFPDLKLCKRIETWSISSISSPTRLLLRTKGYVLTKHMISWNVYDGWFFNNAEGIISLDMRLAALDDFLNYFKHKAGHSEQLGVKLHDQILLNVLSLGTVELIEKEMPTMSPTRKIGLLEAIMEDKRKIEEEIGQKNNKLLLKK